MSAFLYHPVSAPIPQRNICVIVTALQVDSLINFTGVSQNFPARTPLPSALMLRRQVERFSSFAACRLPFFNLLCRKQWVRLMLCDSVKCLFDKMFLRKHFVKCLLDGRRLSAQGKKELNRRKLGIKC